MAGTPDFYPPSSSFFARSPIIFPSVRQLQRSLSHLCDLTNPSRDPATCLSCSVLTPDLHRLRPAPWDQAAVALASRRHPLQSYILGPSKWGVHFGCWTGTNQGRGGNHSWLPVQITSLDDNTRSGNSSRLYLSIRPMQVPLPGNLPKYTETQ